MFNASFHLPIPFSIEFAPCQPSLYDNVVRLFFGVGEYLHQFTLIICISGKMSASKSSMENIRFKTQNINGLEIGEIENE